MTQHKTNLQACEILEQIEERAGALWGECQMYTADPVKQSMVNSLQRILNRLIDYNRQMER